MQALKAPSVIDKVKDLLPFQTLPLFELAQDKADLGPNEVSKDKIKDVGNKVKEGVDTAAPGEPNRQTCRGCLSHPDFSLLKIHASEVVSGEHHRAAPQGAGSMISMAPPSGGQCKEALWEPLSLEHLCRFQGARPKHLPSCHRARRLHWR